MSTVWVVRSQSTIAWEQALLTYAFNVMNTFSRRAFLRSIGLATAAVGLSGASRARAAAFKTGPNETIQLGVIGLGGIQTVGGVGGRGRQLIDSLRQIHGVRVAALCDVDKQILDHGAGLFKERGENVRTYRDLRDLLVDKELDAVLVATPNHWHALATVWACQAGKDVYVEKPFSHSIWEGRQMVAAAAKYQRMVQVGTQSRSSGPLKAAFEYVHGGHLGAIRSAHALVYRPRTAIAKVATPTPIPSSVNYDLWCGPAPMGPLGRSQLHYEWHWFWATGNGEAGNNGIHVIDVCRWGLQLGLPPRVMSIGGRFGFDDMAETPNTQIVFLDYQPAPVICEIRNLRKADGTDRPGKYRQRDGGVVIDCEGGSLVGDSAAVTALDRDGKAVKEFKSENKAEPVEETHLSNFLNAVRTRKADSLHANGTQGHHSASCCHMANISHRLGAQSSPEAILESIRARAEWVEAYERCREHLRANGVELSQTPAVLGPWVQYDSNFDRFVGETGGTANAYLQREYRAPFVVPNQV